jgi:hypothetical protein
MPPIVRCVEHTFAADQSTEQRMPRAWVPRAYAILSTPHRRRIARRVSHVRRHSRRSRRSAASRTHR